MSSPPGMREGNCFHFAYPFENCLISDTSIPPTLLWSLIGLSIVLALSIIGLATVVLICYCYGGRCIKRKYAMSEVIELRPGIKNFIEFNKENSNGTGQLNDGWEIMRNLLEVHEDEMLGSGCFGEVCKGSLQMNYVLNKRRLSHEYLLHQRKRSKSLTPDYFQVAVKKLKSRFDNFLNTYKFEL